MTRNEPERLYSIEDVAELWSISRDAVERLLRDRELLALIVGKRRRIPASELTAYISRTAEREAARVHREHGPDGRFEVLRGGSSR